MSPDVRVDPAILESAGRSADGLRQAVADELADVEPETAQVAKELGGWLTGSASDQLLRWWREDLDGLTARLDHMAEGLGLCARDYRHSDHASADNFQGLGW